ncbi:type I-B CRISPR-associated protein Cas5b [Methanospirillum purgamenti]|uniref:Type I-B CRISPR-associated protein Cas5b n=1 Tax=Methanospirillum hungatei TaxID=2203 RepID=A0A8F5VMQ9_METHU|nr:type I-B CRISPR-associated protein Cas5b [Methanospirillum hungatei]QXO95659.1 type I-B CRISPR-associated protein Cas5b [Methanospirillum hungatei]
MELLRVEITALTASFRYPMFIVGYHPTYSVPPVSTILGLLSAAKGDTVSPNSLRIGYDFYADGKGSDLEKIYEYGGGTNTKPVHFQKSNIITREFLFNCTLNLYLDDFKFEYYLKHPNYPLVLGRQADLAYVRKISRINLEETEDVTLSNTMIPFDGTIPGQVVSLPTFFTDESTRKPQDVRTFLILDSPQSIPYGLYDPERNCGVYLHDYTNPRKK